MSAFDIKLIAIISMVIDHVGVAFFPQVLLFRAIGRLAFPLFAWSIANGAYHTKNINKYLTRLFIFALISQVPYTLFYKSIGISNFSINIFATLFVGLLAIYVYKMTDNKMWFIGSSLTLAVIAQFLNFDFGFTGTLSIICFYLFFNNFLKIFLSQLLIYSVFNSIIIYSQSIGTSGIPDLLLVQPATLLSLIFIYQYNGKKGINSLKYLFYWFYPVHFLIIYGLSYFL